MSRARVLVVAAIVGGSLAVTPPLLGASPSATITCTSGGDTTLTGGDSTTLTPARTGCSISGTIPSTSTLRFSGGSLAVDGGLINDGTITADASGGSLSGSPGQSNVTDSGSISATGGGTLTLAVDRLFVDAGITVAAGSTLAMGLSGDGSPGIVQLQATSLVSVADTATLDVDSATDLSVAGGTLTGVVTDLGPHLQFTPEAAPSVGEVAVAGGAELIGLVPAAWTVDVDSSMSAVDGAVNNGLIRFRQAAARTLTDNGDFDNEGTISATGTGTGSLDIDSFSNEGTVSSAAGSRLSLVRAPANLAGGTLTGGIWDAAGQLDLGGPVAALAADVRIEAGGAIESGGSNNALTGLATITSAGALRAGRSADVSVQHDLAVSGELDVGTGADLQLTGTLSETRSAVTGIGFAAGSTPSAGRLETTGTASLAGTLRPEPDGAVAPTTAAIPFLQSPARSGSFSTVSPDVDPTTSTVIAVTYAPTSASLAFSAASAPAITSSTHARSATKGKPLTLALTASGAPTPRLAVHGLPGGLHLTDHGNGTGTISGTPKQAGRFTLSLFAVSSAGRAETHRTLTVDARPVLTTPTRAVVRHGRHFSILVRATGYPAPTMSAAHLPHGVTLHRDGGGKARLRGRLRTKGSYTVHVTAHNRFGTDTEHLVVHVH